MNKAITSVWKSLFFKSNIYKIRKTIINYLTGEGIKTEMIDGSILATVHDNEYAIDFDLENEYPRCDIMFKVEAEEYQTLELSQKTFIADKINTDEYRHTVVKAFNESIVLETHFYFTSRKMLLSLFYDYFVDLKATVNDAIELTVNEIKKKENKRPIGFAFNAASYKNEEEDKSSKTVACNKEAVNRITDTIS